MKTKTFCYEVGTALIGFSEEEKTEICKEAWQEQSFNDVNDYEQALATIKIIAKNRKNKLTPLK